MHRIAIRLIAVAALTGVAILAVGIGQAPAAGNRRTVYVSAIEYKGGANVADEAYPPLDEPGTVPLGPLGGGYDMSEPDETGRWEVESYRWEPGLIVANVGERITLEIAGINGSRHEAYLMSPAGERTDFVVTRGRLTLVRFRADEVGVWRFVCTVHPPGMTGEIVVFD